MWIVVKQWSANANQLHHLLQLPHAGESNTFQSAVIDCFFSARPLPFGPAYFMNVFFTVLIILADRRILPILSSPHSSQVYGFVLGLRLLELMIL